MRPYQQKAIDDVYTQWDTFKKQFVALVMPTGSGKAACLCNIAKSEAARGQTVLITAHRQELITQLSNTLARNGVFHSVIASKNTIKNTVRVHMEDHGKNFCIPNSRIIVASVQSVKPEDMARLIPLKDRLTIIGDEYHHYTKQSQTWGKIFTPLDKAGARGLGLTATPLRADGKGLSRETDGYADAIVIGPTMRDLINMGFLSDYKIYCPPSDLHLERVKISQSTGEYAEKELKEEIGKSQIVGDIVNHYLRFAPGKRGITFTVGVDMAEQVAEQYRMRGVPAIAVSGNMSDHDRVQALRDLRSGKILQVVNDSVLTEGTDEPSVEVISFARPTQSFGLYCQMFGRGTRISPNTGKTHAIIIDAVSNVMRHGLPDAPREWSLDRRERRSAGKSDAETVRTCQECTAVYERYLDACPFCGEPVPTPAIRSGPEFVDGDLYELTAEVLAQLRGAVARVDMSPQDYRDQLARQGVPQIGIMANVKRHVTRQETVSVLRDTMAQWGGWERARGLSDKEIFRKFYLTYGVDWLTAQASKTDGALSLIEKLNKDMPV
jgi:superfamily II DNA or RNA helicase